MSLDNLFDSNKKWAESVKKSDPAFFDNLSKEQNPRYLWIGCADSRVPASEITGLKSGDIFVHRNVANLVNLTDLNLLSVLQYAVNILKIKDIIVCGHYGCGGVSTALKGEKNGLIDNWIKKIHDLYYFNEDKFKGLSESEKIDKMCEVNVIEQAKTLARTVIVKEHWDEGKELNIHALIYKLKDGLLKDLNVGLKRGCDVYKR